jgi:MFS family permease
LSTTIRQVFSERNIATLSITTFLFSAIHFIWASWSSLYLLALGATPEMVGFFVLFQEAPRQLFQFPGGLLADRFGRKRIIVYCTALQIVAPLSFLFASTWQQLLPGQFFDSIVWSLYQPARQALVAESLPKEKRGSAFGAFRTITSIPRIFLPVLSGMLMDQVGVVAGVRIGFILIIIGHVVITTIRAVYLRETLKPDVTERIGTSFLRESKRLFSLRGTILILLIVTTLSGFLVRMVQPFLVVYAVNVVKLTKTQWGAINTITGLIGTILAFPSGMISDRVGRRFSIILARALNPLNRVILLFIRDFNQILFLHVLVGIGAALGGEVTGSMGSMGGPAWSALISDVVPSKDRAKIMGFMSMFSGLASMPSSIIGGYIWTNLGPDFLLASTFLAGMIPLVIFYFLVKEPQIKEL